MYSFNSGSDKKRKPNNVEHISICKQQTIREHVNKNRKYMMMQIKSENINDDDVNNPS